MSAPWKCEHCGADAWWNVSRGVVYYICQARCDGWAQLTLDLTTTVHGVRLDSVDSVSALGEAREPGLKHISEILGEDLPF